MESTFFNDMTSSHFNPSAVLDISGGGVHKTKVLIISDFHMGTGRRDDLTHNGELLISLLQNYYFEQGWILVLNGDIEELQRYSLDAVKENWPRMYQVFDLFAQENRLFKIIGNHDEALLRKKYYQYDLYNALRIETGFNPIYVYHGHQSSQMYVKYKNVVSASIRYFLKPFGIRNISSARSPYRRFYVEKQAYEFSRKNGCISIIGHTHRPLFESLGRFEYIKFEIERLCRDYPSSSGAEKERIAGEVAALKVDLGKLKRKERRDVLRQSLYGDELPVPCLFNSGSAIGRKGINAIELDRENIALVYWYSDGEGKRFINRGTYTREKLGNTKYRRAVLNQDRLDYIQARIALLGS